MTEITLLLYVNVYCIHRISILNSKIIGKGGDLHLELLMHKLRKKTNN